MSADGRTARGLSAERLDLARIASLMSAVERATAQVPGFLIQKGTRELLERICELDLKEITFGVNSDGALKQIFQTCRAIAPYRQIGIPADGIEGAPLSHELKTRIYRTSSGRYVFAHLRGDTQIDEDRLREEIGEEMNAADLSELGLEHGMVSPFIQIPDHENIHVFDADLLKRYSHFHRVTTNAHDRLLFVEFNPNELAHQMDKSGDDVRVASIGQEAREVLDHTDAAFSRMVHILGGNGPETSIELTSLIHRYTLQLLKALDVPRFGNMSQLAMSIQNDPRAALSMNLERYLWEVANDDRVKRVPLLFGGGSIVVMPCNTRSYSDESFLGSEAYVSLAQAGIDSIERLPADKRRLVLMVACDAARQYTYTAERLQQLTASGSTITWPNQKESVDLEACVNGIKADEGDVTSSRANQTRGRLMGWMGHVADRIQPDVIAIGNTEVDLLTPDLVRKVGKRRPDIKWVGFLDACAKEVVARAFKLPEGFDQFMAKRAAQSPTS